MTDRLFIVTGGPGTDKSSLIDALARAGWRHAPEAGRAVIQAQRAIGGSALPWADRAAFAEAMLARDLRSYREALALPGPVIFDRGIPDILGYLRLCGLPVPTHVVDAARHHRYNPRVFLAPYWPAIYACDAERRQDLAEAEATGRMMAHIYAELGYEVVPLPFASIAERMTFVERHIAGRAVRP